MRTWKVIFPTFIVVVLLIMGIFWGLIILHDGERTRRKTGLKDAKAIVPKTIQNENAGRGEATGGTCSSRDSKGGGHRKRGNQDKHLAKKPLKGTCQTSPRDKGAAKTIIPVVKTVTQFVAIATTCTAAATGAGPAIEKVKGQIQTQAAVASSESKHKDAAKGVECKKARQSYGKRIIITVKSAIFSGKRKVKRLLRRIMPGKNQRCKETTPKKIDTKERHVKGQHPAKRTDEDCYHVSYAAVAQKFPCQKLGITKQSHPTGGLRLADQQVNSIIGLWKGSQKIVPHPCDPVDNRNVTNKSHVPQRPPPILGPANATVASKAHGTAAANVAQVKEFRDILGNKHSVHIMQKTIPFGFPSHETHYIMVNKHHVILNKEYNPLPQHPDHGNKFLHVPPHIYHENQHFFTGFQGIEETDDINYKGNSFRCWKHVPAKVALDPKYYGNNREILIRVPPDPVTGSKGKLTDKSLVIFCVKS